MTILHGDDRIYNNIFVQGRPADEPVKKGGPEEGDRVVGTWCFDEYPTYEEWIAWFDMDVERPDMKKLAEFHARHLPVWIDGNAYFNGAKAWKNESSKLVNDQDRVTVELLEKDGAYTLKTNLYELLGDFTNGIINSDILGYAFEPEQRFERPDGSAVTFDFDYFGNHRGVHTVPGPFASEAALKDRLW
jgi:hypothetical protein